MDAVVLDVIRIPNLAAADLPFRVESGYWRAYNAHIERFDTATLGAIDGLVRGFIKWDRGNQAVCRRRLARNGVVAALEAFRRGQPGDAYPMDWVDLWYLYAHIRRARPARVLELGSGCSTLVMAKALEDNGAGRLWAVDPNAKWAEATRAALPAGLAARADVRHSASVPFCLRGRDTMRFADIPVDDPDMIYLDGAAEGARFQGAEDVVHMADRLRPGTTIFIDARIRAFGELAVALQDRSDVFSQMFIFTIDGVPDICFGLDQFANTMVTVREAAPSAER